MNFTGIMSLVEEGTVSFDDVKEYRENVHMICEAYVRGDITHEQKEELMLENRRVYFGHLFEEKATRLEYTMRQFKKKYHYDPQKKTIVVDGETYKCDLDINNPIIKVKDMNGNNKFEIRRTGTSLDDPDRTIVLDKSFFEVKNNKRRDALLQHEVGHQKLHSITGNYDILVDEFAKTFKTFGYSDEDASNAVIGILNERGLTREKFATKGTEEIANIRREIRKEIKEKYCKNSNRFNHISPKEIEADRYSSNKTSPNQLKKGVRDYYKRCKSDNSIRKLIDGHNESERKNWHISKKNFGKEDGKLDKTKKNIEELRKINNKNASEDYRKRSNAMKSSGIEKDPEKNKLYQ